MLTFTKQHKDTKHTKNTRMYDGGLREFPMAHYTKFNLADNSDMRYDRDLTSLIISNESTDIS